MQSFSSIIFGCLFATLVPTYLGSTENANSGSQQTNKNKELFKAVRAKNGERIRQLVNEGADVNARDEVVLNRTVLHSASSTGDVEVVNFLLSLSAVISAKDQDGNEPIHLAAMGGHWNVIEVFLNKGVNVNVQNNYGFTPLHWTAVYGHKAAATKLLEKGANIFAKARTAGDPVDREPYLTAADIASRNNEPALEVYLKGKQTELSG